jgi:hypothetical protein
MKTHRYASDAVKAAAKTRYNKIKGADETSSDTDIVKINRR